jgi:hypothetical protein
VCIISGTFGRLCLSPVAFLTVSCTDKRFSLDSLSALVAAWSTSSDSASTDAFRLG